MGRSSAPPVSGEFVRQRRLLKCLTQADVARECSERGYWMDQSYVSRIEGGEIRWPALKALPVLAEVLDVEVTDLFSAAEAA